MMKIAEQVKSFYKQAYNINQKTDNLIANIIDYINGYEDFNIDDIDFGDINVTYTGDIVLDGCIMKLSKNEDTIQFEVGDCNGDDVSDNLYNGVFSRLEDYLSILDYLNCLELKRKEIE